MKPPLTPPRLEEILKSLSQESLQQAVLSAKNPLVQGRYLHWDELRHRTPPEGMNHAAWWLSIKLARQGQIRLLPLCDKYARPIGFSMPEPLLLALGRLEGGRALDGGYAERPLTRVGGDAHLVSSLLGESISSSQLEGASTTRTVAEAMLREGRDPFDASERMIFNNYRAMQWVRSMKDQALTPEAVLELHRVISERTLENPADAGRLRLPDDIRVRDNRDGMVLHEPPRADTLPERLVQLCAFANGERPDHALVPPIVRAILLHFMLGYDHPFVDGNGRTARALFYWCMLRHGYVLMEYISISHLIKRSPAQYSRAFLLTETDENDATYFLLHQLEVIEKSVEFLNEKLARKHSEQKETERILRNTRTLRGQLNPRQMALLTHALKHPGFDYEIDEYRRSHNVVYATARSDLLGLAALGLLEQTKRGRAVVFIAPDDLRQRIESAHTVKG